MKDEELARILFRAYYKSLDKTNTWESATPNEQKAWEYAAHQANWWNQYPAGMK